MAVWQIVVLYLVIFALLQLFVYRYLRGDESQPARFGSASNPDAGMAEERRPDASPATDASTRVDDPDGARYCPQCGARNDAEQMYSYCRNCAGALGRG